MLFLAGIIIIYMGLWIVSNFAFKKGLSTIQQRGLIAIALLFVGTGFFQLLFPTLFTPMIKGFLPYPNELINFTGFMEMVGGIGLLIPRVRKEAAKGLILLLIMVYPANIYVLIHHIPGPLGPEWEPWCSYSRLILHPLFIWIVWYVTPLTRKREKKNHW